ncbi:hypothetical protein AVEN_186418-1 [Araneus ventricosus]|uniref:Uncharacterized protein n=1 Tax=Araneus ventricosus TaxID=182803 RepID=A0A4Y2D2D3_ARAVE|nr:hypothetical protein AVEN_186418-1 [Araneus ventricosus]
MVSVSQSITLLDWQTLYPLITSSGAILNPWLDIRVDSAEELIATLPRKSKTRLESFSVFGIPSDRNARLAYISMALQIPIFTS